MTTEPPASTKRRMRRILLSLLLLAPVTSFAQQNEFSLFATPTYFGHSSEFGSEENVGFGIGYRHAFHEHFALDASVARERYTTARVMNLGSDFPYLRRYQGRTIPIDVATLYLFTNESNWKPYVGGGLHIAYVQSSPVAGSHGWFTPVISGGVAYRVSPRWGVFLEARQLVTSNVRPEDPRTRGLLGFRWRF